METQLAPATENQFTNIIGLRSSGIFPKDKEPSVATLRNWTKLRRIPHHRVGHFIYYNAAGRTGILGGILDRGAICPADHGGRSVFPSIQSPSTQMTVGVAGNP